MLKRGLKIAIVGATFFLTVFGFTPIKAEESLCEIFSYELFQEHGGTYTNKRDIDFLLINLRKSNIINVGSDVKVDFVDVYLVDGKWVMTLMIEGVRTIIKIDEDQWNNLNTNIDESCM